MNIDLEKLKSIAIKMAELNKVPSPVLVFGEPGSGKTYTGNELASKFGTKPHFIQCSRLTDEIMEGLENFCKGAVNSSADAMKDWMGESTGMPMVFLDEIEQLGGSVSIDRLRPLIDNYGKQVFFYATTNYIEKIPDGVRDRFLVSEAKNQSELSRRQQELLQRMGFEA